MTARRAPGNDLGEGSGRSRAHAVLTPGTATRRSMVYRCDTPPFESSPTVETVISPILPRTPRATARAQPSTERCAGDRAASGRRLCRALLPLLLVATVLAWVPNRRDDAPRGRHGGAAYAAQGVAESPCHGRATRRVAPPSVLLGEAVTVSVRIDLECPGEPLPLDVALVIDRSPSMKGEAIADARAAATAFVERIDLDRHRIGVASFHGSATIDARLSGDARHIRSAIGAIEVPQRGGTDIADGLRAGGRVLTDQRSRAEAGRVLILLSDGQNNYGPLPVLQSAAILEEAGVHIVTLALGGAADTALLAAIASSPQDALVAPFSRDLGGAFERIADRLASVAARDLVLDDDLPEDVAFVPRSAQPAAAFDGDRLRWTVPLAPSGPLTFTWRVRPTRAGVRPITHGGALTFEDTAGRSGQLGLPLGSVLVRDPAAPLTATPSPSPTRLAQPPTLPPPRGSSTPTPAATTSATPMAGAATATPGPAVSRTPVGTPANAATATARTTATAAAGATATAETRRANAVYLPVAGASVCRAKSRRLDLMLVIDASTTMRLPADDGRPRIDAAMAAARGLAERLLGTKQDVRLGAVTFDEQARLWLPPTDDRDGVLARLREPVPTSRGSRMDRGLQLAARTLLDLDHAHAGPATPVVVILSDGQVVGAPDADVIAAAAQWREGGVEIWSVALGRDARTELLARIAGGPNRLLRPAGTAGLAEALRALASLLACP